MNAAAFKAGRSCTHVQSIKLEHDGNHIAPQATRPKSEGKGVPNEHRGAIFGVVSTKINLLFDLRCMASTLA